MLQPLSIRFFTARGIELASASCDIIVRTYVPLDEDCVILSMLLLSSCLIESARRQKNGDLPGTSHVSLCSINRIELIDSKLKR